MGEFSFYLGASPVSTVMYIGLWIVVSVVLLLAKPARQVSLQLRLVLIVIAAMLITAITVKVGHRQASLNRQQFDTPTLTDQKEVIQSTRMTRADADKSLKTQIEKQREENTK